jgi:hypothetical protein
MPLYDVQCQGGHRTEVLSSAEATAWGCPRCQQPAKRVYGYRVAIGQPVTDTRGLFRRFSEASQEMGYAAERVEQSTGQSVPGPNLWQQAKTRAQQMTAAGEAPPVRREW